jgi:Leucine carboxyl methyltransferase
VDAAPGAFPEEPETGAQLAAPGPTASLGAVFYVRAVIRTRFFDDYLTAATAAGCRQVVLLAAGLDTRAFRLAWPKGTCVFEVDLPGVLAFKDTVLAARSAVPRCERTGVPADLRADWTATLAKAGFEHSHMAAARLTDQARQMPAMQRYTSLWKGGLGDDAPRWLPGHGWRPQFHELAALAASYRRPVPGQARGGFLTAIRGQSGPDHGPEPHTASRST